MQISNSGNIYRKLNEIIYFEESNENKEGELLLQIKKTNDKNYELITNDCKLDENKNIQSRNNCWFVLKKSKLDDKYKINQGDIIRLGRITTRIKEIRIDNILKISRNFDYSNKNNKDINKNDKINFREMETKENEPKINVLTFSTDLNQDKKYNEHIILKEKNNKINVLKSININAKSYQKIYKNKISKICRICYGEEEENEIDNPLVQPCKCSGSLKYIHLNCLKHWLNTKSCAKMESNENYSIFLVKQVECEICKSKYPDFLKLNGKLHEILDFKSEFKNYFTLESLTIDKNNTRCIYVINLDNNIRLKIGRGHDANLTLSDISVSRVHCIITIENKNIFIEDNNSKFGTLILVQSPSLKLIENLPLFIQIGRTFLDCRIKKSYKLFSCCGVNEIHNNNFYFQQNENQKQLELLNMFDIKSKFDFTDDYEKEDKSKDFDKINIDETQNLINNRYEDTLVPENIKKDENEFNISTKNKSNFYNEENKNNIPENSEEKYKKYINQDESIILESEKVK